MAKVVLTNASVYVDEHDVSGDMNTVELAMSIDVKECTVFGDTWRNRAAGGFKNVSLTAGGYWDAETVDTHAFTNLGVGRTATSVTGTGDDGAVSYLFQGIDTSFDLLGDAGEVAPFNLSQMGRDSVGAVRGQLLLPKQTVTGNVSGTGVQMGAVASTEKVYTVIHVFTAGTTADVIVESDDNSGFTSATTRSSTTVTAVGGTWVTPVNGAITDDYWRVRIATVTGSFSIAAAVAIA